MLLQVNVEMLLLDKRSFLTDQDRAMQSLFGDAHDASATYRTELGVMAGRLASAFAAMKVTGFFFLFSFFSKVTGCAARSRGFWFAVGQ